MAQDLADSYVCSGYTCCPSTVEGVVCPAPDPKGRWQLLKDTNRPLGLPGLVEAAGVNQEALAQAIAETKACTLDHADIWVINWEVDFNIGQTDQTVRKGYDVHLEIRDWLLAADLFREFSDRTYEACSKVTTNECEEGDIHPGLHRQIEVGVLAYHRQLAGGGGAHHIALAGQQLGRHVVDAKGVPQTKGLSDMVRELFDKPYSNHYGLLQHNKPDVHDPLYRNYYHRQKGCHIDQKPILVDCVTPDKRLQDFCHPDHNETPPHYADY